DAVPEVVHGAAALLAGGVGAAEPHTEEGLAVLGGHADHAGEPHPEDGSGTAQGDGGGDTGDVADAHGRGEGGGEGLVMGDVAFGLGVGAFDEGEPEGE